MKKIGIVWLLFLSFTLSCFASQSFIESIYSANQTDVIRILEGNSNKKATVDTQPSDFSKEVIDRNGSFHDIASTTQNKPEFQPLVENKIMDEIYKALNRTSTAKGVINVRTLSLTKTTLSNDKPVGVSISVKVGDTNEEIQKKSRLAYEKYWIARIKRTFDIELEGGISAEGGFWNEEQMSLLEKLLKTLPIHFISKTLKIERVKSFGSRTGVMGYVFAGQPKVYICNWGVRPTKYEETIVHEMAHVWMFDKENLAAKTGYMNKFWPNNARPVSGQEQPPSVYGTSNVFEDFAESVRLYWQDCPTFKKTHPGRWAFLNKYVFKGRRYLKAAQPGSANSKTINVNKTRQY